jgi:hypothetical protein
MLLGQLDEEVLSYVLSTLDDVEEDDDQGLDAIVELLTAHGLEADSDELKAELRQAKHAGGAQTVTAAAPSVPAHVPAPSPSTPAPQTRSADCEAASSSSSATGTKGGAAALLEPSSRIVHAKAAEALSAGVQMLIEMIPQASPELSLYVLEKHHGDTEEALDCLLTAASIKDLEDECRQARDTAKRTQEATRAAEAKAERRRALARNDMQRDYAADGKELKLAPPRLPYNESRKDALRGPTLRYRDGEEVHVKGNPRNESKWEKKEEWDGGSTGRVKTKGKRGPGWV